MPEKFIGYILLVLGIVIIFFSGVSVYNVFTKKEKPVNLFQFNGISLNNSQLLSGVVPQQSLDQIKEQKTDIISPEIINDTSNIFAHLMLMGFLVSIGYKLATLGTYLMRPIRVNLKTEEKKVL